ANLLDDFKRILKRAGLPDIRFHDLRHSAASLLLALNVHPRVVMELLGHSQISLTMNTYSHVVSDVLRDAVGKLGTVLGTDPTPLAVNWLSKTLSEVRQVEESA